MNQAMLGLVAIGMQLRIVSRIKKQTLEDAAEVSAGLSGSSVFLPIMNGLTGPCEESHVLPQAIRRRVVSSREWDVCAVSMRLQEGGQAARLVGSSTAVAVHAPQLSAVDDDGNDNRHEPWLIRRRWWQTSRSSTTSSPQSATCARTSRSMPCRR